MRCNLTRGMKTTNQQISEARDLLIMRISMQKWQAKVQRRREYHQQISATFELRRLKRAMDMWRMKLHAKRQIQWRDSMRSRMKVVRLSREKKLKSDAWAKWRQLYQSRLSAQHYSKHLLVRSFSRWRRRLAGVDEVEDTGENLAQVFDSRRVSRFWYIWRKASALRAAESLLVERVNLRVMNDAMAVWKKRMWAIGFCFVWAGPILLSSPGGTLPSQKNSAINPQNGGRSAHGRKPGAGYGYAFHACPRF